jgi:hypothetical protein
LSESLENFNEGLALNHILIGEVFSQFFYTIFINFFCTFNFLLTFSLNIQTLRTNSLLRLVGTNIRAMSGDEWFVSSPDGVTVTVSNGKVVGTQIITDNGVVHIIDAVLLPILPRIPGIIHITVI